MELRDLWNSLVTQVHDAGLVLGTWAEVPPQKEHTGAPTNLTTDGYRSQGTTVQVPLRAPGCGGRAQPVVTASVTCGI